MDIGDELQDPSVSLLLKIKAEPEGEHILQIEAIQFLTRESSVLKIWSGGVKVSRCSGVIDYFVLPRVGI